MIDAIVQAVHQDMAAVEIKKINQILNSGLLSGISPSMNHTQGYICLYGLLYFVEKYEFLILPKVQNK